MCRESCIGNLAQFSLIISISMDNLSVCCYTLRVRTEEIELKYIRYTSLRFRHPLIVYWSPPSLPPSYLLHLSFFSYLFCSIPFFSVIIYSFFVSTEATLSARGLDHYCLLRLLVCPSLSSLPLSSLFS